METVEDRTDGFRFWLQRIEFTENIASGVEVDPNRHVIGGFFPATHFLFDPTIAQKVCALRSQQKMIDPNAVVSVPCPGLVIPERIVPRGH